MDPVLYKSLAPKTVQQYRREGREFVVYLDYHGVAPELAMEWDDLLVEYKNGVDLPEGMSAPTRSKFEKLLASVEKILPHFKGELCLSHAILNAWKVAFAPVHTVPMVPRWGVVVCDGLLRHGHPRAAGVLYLQFMHGLRPGEAFGLTPMALVLPEESRSTMGKGVIILGMKKGTKAGRQQTVLVDDPLSLALLRAFRQTVASSDLLSDIRSLTGLSSLMRRAVLDRNLPMPGWTPHSGRAGYATDAYLRGVTLARIAEICRWQSIKTLRIYLDAASATASAVSRTLEQHSWVADRCAEEFPGMILGALDQLRR